MRQDPVLKSILLVIALLTPSALQADVKTQEKSQMKFEGMIGRMMGMFGGKAAKEGVLSTTAVKGNRKMTADEYTGEIIDLDEEKVYRLDMRKKSYEVITFDQMRREMKEAQARAEKAARDMSGGEKETPDKSGKQMEIDFSLKESGQKNAINGYSCREVIATVTMREKGKTLEQGGGMVMTSNIWLGPRIAAFKEIQEFEVRYAKKLDLPFAFGADSAQQMAAALAMYPGMMDVLGKLQNEKVNMDGTEILTVSKMEMVQSPEQARQQGDEPAEASPIRGIGGLLGRKLGGKKQEAETGAKDRATVFTMTHELVSAATSVGPSDLAVPAGFKAKK